MLRETLRKPQEEPSEGIRELSIEDEVSPELKKAVTETTELTDQVFQLLERTRQYRDKHRLKTFLREKGEQLREFSRGKFFNKKFALKSAVGYGGGFVVKEGVTALAGAAGLEPDQAEGLGWAIGYTSSYLVYLPQVEKAYNGVTDKARAWEEQMANWRAQATSSQIEQTI